MTKYGTDVTIAGKIITTTVQLTVNHHYTLSVKANNTAGSFTSYELISEYFKTFNVCTYTDYLAYYLAFKTYNCYIARH